MFTDTSSVSSARTQGSMLRSRFASSILSGVFPLFQFLCAVEVDLHEVFAVAEFAICFFQALGFVLNPHQVHGETLHAFSYVVYAFQLPFWDSKFVPSVTFTQYMAPFAIAVAITLVFVTTAAYSILRKIPITRSSWNVKLWRLTLHLMSTVLFVPLLQAYLSQLVCVDGFLWAFPAQECFQGNSTIATFVFACVALIALVPLTLLAQITLFSQDPLSANLLSRGSDVVGYLYTLWQFLSCVLFHVFVSNATGQTVMWMNMYVFFSCTLLAMAYAFFLPYYHQKVNRWCVSGFLFVAATGLMVYLSSEDIFLSPGARVYHGGKTMLAVMDIDGILFVTLLIPLICLGHWLADHRINRNLVMALEHIVDSTRPSPPEDVCYKFPRHLPVYDKVYETYRDLIQDIADGAVTDYPAPYPPLSQPMLTAVYCASDVEVAVRFLRACERLTKNPPTEDMLQFGASIYVKGLLRFKSAGDLAIAFAYMISAFSSKQSLALQQCERCVSMPLFFASEFRAYRLQSRLKVELNLRDTAYQRLCDRAKKLHKEVLILVNQLWYRLQSRQNIVQLLAVTSQASLRRAEGDATFRKALRFRSSDRLLVLKYADFLDEVMLQSDIADSLRTVTRQDMEERRRQTGGTKANTTSQMHNSVVNSILRTWERRNKLFQMSQMSISLFLRITIPFVIFALAVAFIAATMVTSDRRLKATNSFYGACRSRTLMLLGTLLAVQQFVGELGTNPANFSESGERLNSITAIGMDLLALHNSITYGTKHFAVRSREGFLRQNNLFTVKLIGERTELFEVANFWSIGYNIVQLLLDIPATVGRNSSAVSATDRDIVEQQLAVQRNTAMYLMDTWADAAYNNTIERTKQWSETEHEGSLILFVVLYGVSVLFVVILSELLIAGSNEAESLRRSVVSLFSLIPMEKVQVMAAISKQKVDTFDEQQYEDDDGMGILNQTAMMGKDQVLNDDDDEEQEMKEKQAAGPKLPGELGLSGDVVAMEGRGAGGFDDEGSPKGEDRDDDSDVDATGPTALSGYGSTEASIREHLLSNSEESGAGLEESEEVPQVADLRPLGYMYHASMILFVSLLVAMLVTVSVAALSSANELQSRIHTWNRFQQYGLLASAATKMLVDTVVIFTTGSTEVYLYSVSVLAQLPRFFTSTLVYLPSEVEVENLRRLVESASQLSHAISKYNSIFMANPSNLVGEYANESHVPPTNSIGEGARDALFAGDGTLYTGMMQISLALNETTQTTRAFIVSSSEQKMVWNLNLGALLLGISALMVFAVFVASLRGNRAIFYTRFKVFLLVLVGLALLAFVGCAAAQFAVWVRQNHRSVEFVNAVGLQDEFARYFLTTWELAAVFSHGLRQLDYERYFNFILDTPPPVLPELSNATRSAVYSLSVHEMQRLQNISMRLIASGAGMTDVSDLENFTWDFDAEPDAEQLVLRFPDEPLRYSTKAEDLLRDSNTQILMGRFILTSPRFMLLMSQATGLASSFNGEVLASFQANVRSDHDISAGLSTALIALACVLIFVVAVFVILSRFQYHGAQHQQQLFIDSNIRGVSIMSSLGTRGPLLGLIGLFTVLFVISFYSIIESRLTVDNNQNLQARMWVVLSGMITAERWVGGYFTQHQAQVALSASVASLQAIADMIYGPSSSGVVETSLDKPKATLHPDFQYWYRPPGSIDPEVMLYEGLMTAQSQWSVYVLALAAANSLAEGMEAIGSMRKFIMPLLTAFDNAAVEYMDTLASKIDTFNYAIITLASVTSFAVIVSIFFIIFPALRTQEANKRDSRSLLRLIPDEVRESIPAIGEWIALENMQEAGVTQQRSTSDTIRDAIIVIDTAGTVLKFNQPAEVVFGFTAAEVIGNNVSMLMPDRIAQHHTSYIERYVWDSGPHELIFSRRLFAKHKSGTIFPVELTVHEFRRDSGGLVFIGFVRDATKEIEQRKEEHLSNLIQDYATVPMIAIDSLGTVLRYNRTAEECFGHAAHDIINQNIKILMPEDIAAHHDTYLATYLRTREKRVINSSTRTRGIRKNGEEFAIEISVREIVVNDSTSTYLAFIRDLSQEVALDEAIRINSAVVDLSPVPIITIDPYGKVLNFSNIASKVFGYDPSEVINNNCKMLMPDNIADQHDSYLAAYQSTWGKKSSAVDREVYGRRKDGTLVPLRLLVHEVKKAGITNGAFIGFLFELAEDRAIERRLSIDEVTEENHIVPLVIADAVGIIIRVNRALLTEFGYRRGEIVGKNVKVLMMDDVAEQHDRYIHRYLESGVSSLIGVPRRMRARRRIGTPFPIELRLNEIHDEKGRPIFVAFLRNISRDLRLERQCAINEAMTKFSPAPLLAISGKGEIIIFNAAAEKTWKYTADQVLGRNVSMLMPEHVARSHDFYLERYHTTKVKTVVDNITIHEARDATGRIFPMEIGVREVRSAHKGEPNWFFAHCRDMTEDGESHQIEQRNLQVTELSPVPLIRINHLGIIDAFNAAAEREFGYHRSEVIGEDVSLILPPDPKDKHASFLETHRHTHASAAVGSVRRSEARRKDGTLLSIELLVSEITVEGDAEKNMFICYVRNITKELNLRRATDLSSLFLDLSPNPLVAINQSGSIIIFNRAACESFRYKSPSEVIGQNVKIIIPEEIAAEHDGYLTAYRKTGKKKAISTVRTVMGRRSDGTLFPCTTMIHEIRKDNSDSSIFLSCIVDKSEEISVMQATSISSAILALSVDPLIMIDEVGIIHRISDVTPRVFGYDSVAELIGQNVKILIPGNFAREHDRYLSQYRTTRRQRVINRKRILFAKRKDDSTFNVELSVREVNAEGQIFYVGYLRDLTPSNDLRDKRKLNIAITESCPVPLVIINYTGIVRVFTPAAEEFFKYKSAEVVGNNVKMLMPQDDASKHDEYLSQYQITHKKHVVGSTTHRVAKLKNGELVPISLRVRELPSRNGTDLGDFIGYIIDRRQESVAARSEKVAHVLMESVPFPVLLVTESGVICESSRQVRDQFGYVKEQLCGKNVSVLLPISALQPEGIGAFGQDPGESSEPGAEQKKTTFTQSYSRQVEVLKNDGSLHLVLLHVSQLYQPPQSEGDSQQRFFIFEPIKQQQDVSHARQLQAALADFSRVAIVQCGTKNTIDVFNPSAEAIFGWKAQEVNGRNVSLLIPDAIARKHDKNIDKFRKNHNLHNFSRKRQLSAKKRSGEDLILNLSLHEVGESLVAFIADMTRQKLDRTEAAIFECIIEHMKDPFFIVSKDDNVVAISNAAVELIGYSRSEAQNCRLFILDGIVAPHNRYFHSDNPLNSAFETQYVEEQKKNDLGAGSEPHVKRVTLEAKESERRTQCLRSDGNAIEVELHVKELTGESGEVHYMVFLRDCTSDNELARETELGEALIEANPNAIVAIDPRGTILKFSAMAERLFQFERNQVIGRNIKLLMTAQDAMFHDEYLQQYSLTGVKRVVGRLRNVVAERKNGETFQAELSVREVLNENGKAMLFVGYLREINS